MESLKRLFSCMVIMIVCVASNLGLKVNANIVLPQKPMLSEQSSLLYLYSGNVLSSDMKKDDMKLADHYSHVSHSSHSSHSSHYSSRY